MLDEIVSDADTAPLSPDATAPEIKVPPAEAIFGHKPLDDSGKPAASGAGTPPPLPDAAAPEIKIQPADAIPGRMLVKETDKASARQRPSFFRRLFRFCVGALAVVGLCALAGAAGAYYSRNHSLLGFLKLSSASEAQLGQQRDDTASAVRQMTEEMRALKASIAERDSARNVGQKNQSKSGQAATGATVADLVGRVDKLDADFAAKLSQVNEQLTSIEQKISEPHAALAAHARPPHKRVKHLHDAFDPARDPNAPGVPRALGAR